MEQIIEPVVKAPLGVQSHTMQISEIENRKLSDNLHTHNVRHSIYILYL